MVDGLEGLMVGLVIVLFALIGFVIYDSVQDKKEFDAMTTTSSIKEALSKDIDSKVFISGDVEEFDKKETNLWFIFIPIVISNGKSTSIILMPVPMTDVKYVYKVTDSTGYVPVKFESKQTLGSKVSVKGYVKQAKGAGTKYISEW